MDISPSILIVDDHQSIRDPLSAYLSKFDFYVEAVEDGKAMRQRLRERGFSLIVLDIMLPGENGLSLCRYVSEHHGIPVILLTAVTEQADRVAGLEIGADDYIVKPFDPRELVARIRSVLRRSATQMDVDADDGSGTSFHAYLFNGWCFYVDTRELRDPSGKIVGISTAEFHLLRALVENANRVLSREQLLDLTQKHGAISFDRSIDSQISRLRKKLEVDTRQPRMIKTVRGDGYMLTGSIKKTKAA
ncbi:response regulator transcription factor [Pusillimonas sp. CC-YST705]|uniref:Response regulator transcription factor n=1 Tax=Mesopusillimonas faecipullorum TaxID=2755040 RepID=A0ABS8C8K6_9BURK|nr:response regulator transcription factor [Mesopusillimonas faecipullorum]MCB5362354.1 response regulator transcription factor [Mesopusillimonas faecipullorum]